MNDSANNSSITSIDEVIAQLKLMVEDGINTNNRAGYFAALYYKVTCRIKEGIGRNEFENNARMEKLDVLFANRYLSAWRSWNSKQPLSASWAAAFSMLDNSSTLVLQQLLLAINAHINVDLGIAVVEAIDGYDIGGLQKDFYAINSILGAMVYKTISEINKVSPLLSLMGLNASNQNSMLIQFTLDEARDGAWVFAQDLSKKTGHEFQACITSRDKRISELAVGIARPVGFLKLTTFIIHLFEWHNPSKIIKLLEGAK